jgi:RHS repeat-associated protein
VVHASANPAATGTLLSEAFNDTGQRRDETGLLYDNARYYDPALGRFLSADTVVPDPQNPQALNRYAYALNNPVGYTDPTGHCIPGIGDGRPFWETGQGPNWRDGGAFFTGVPRVEQTNVTSTRAAKGTTAPIPGRLTYAKTPAPAVTAQLVRAPGVWRWVSTPFADGWRMEGAARSPDRCAQRAEAPGGAACEAGMWPSGRVAGSLCAEGRSTG